MSFGLPQILRNADCNLPLNDMKCRAPKQTDNILQFCILPQNQQCFTVETFAADRKTTHPFSAHCHRVFPATLHGATTSQVRDGDSDSYGNRSHNTSHFHPFPLMNDAVCMSHTFPSLCASFKICICVSCM